MKKFLVGLLFVLGCFSIILPSVGPIKAHASADVWNTKKRAACRSFFVFGILDFRFVFSPYGRKQLKCGGRVKPFRY